MLRGSRDLLVGVDNVDRPLRRVRSVSFFFGCIVVGSVRGKGTDNRTADESWAAYNARPANISANIDSTFACSRRQETP